jgi:DNA repair protein RecO (recombination protein O)
MREPAICLAVTDYSETSQVVQFLTRGAGLVRLMAKGSKRARSKSGGAIDILSEGDAVFISPRGEGLGTLVEFTETRARAALRKDAAALDAALFMIEAAGRLLGPGDPHPEIFDLLRNSLSRVGQEGAPREAVLAYFLWRLLRHAGLLGELRVCVSCGSPTRGKPDIPGPRGERGKAAAHFSSSLGGLLCEACEGSVVEKYRVSEAAAAAIDALEAAEAGRRAALPANQASAAIQLLAYHVAQQTGRPLRMAKRIK